MSPVRVQPQAFVRVRVSSKHATDFFFSDLRVDDLPAVRELISELCKAEELLEEIQEEDERR